MSQEIAEDVRRLDNVNNGSESASGERDPYLDFRAGSTPAEKSGARVMVADDSSAVSFKGMDKIDLKESLPVAAGKDGFQLVSDTKAVGDGIDEKTKDKIVDAIKDGKLNDEFKDSFIKAAENGGIAGMADLAKELNDKLKDKKSDFRVSMGAVLDKKTGDAFVKVWISDKPNDDPKGQPFLILQLKAK